MFLFFYPYGVVLSPVIKKSNVKRIVVIAPSIGMGEVVFISMVVGVIKDNIPGAVVTFISGEYSCAFLRFIPGVSECISLESLGFSRSRSLQNSGILSKLKYLFLFPHVLLALRRGAFDLALVSGRGRFFTSWIHLLLRISGTHQVVLLKNMLQNHLSSDLHVVDSYRAILRDIGLTVDENIEPSLSLSSEAEAEAREFLLSKGIEAGRHKVIGICPLSTREIKNWSSAKFIELMTRLRVDGDVRLIVFAHGSGEAVKVFKESGGGSLIVGSLSLEKLMALIKHCDLFISVDTGPMHIAAAFGIPTVGIFGPTAATMYGPYGKGNIVLGADAPGCRYFDPTFMGSDKVQLCYSEDRCLIDKESCVNRVTVEEVLGAAAKLLS